MSALVSCAALTMGIECVTASPSGGTKGVLLKLRLIDQ
jgi:hypothetical protein